MLAAVVLRKFSRNDSLIATQLTRGMLLQLAQELAPARAIHVKLAPVMTSPSLQQPVQRAESM